MKEIIEIGGAIIIAVGGAGGLILALSNYFGKILADKYIERTRMNFQNQINEYQNKLDILKQTTLRYSDKQFEHYSNLWISLIDLKNLGHELWNAATESNLIKFSKQLNVTKLQIERSAIFLEDTHYNELMETLKSFATYQYGKVKLIDYRSVGQPDDSFAIQMINDNWKEKVRYEKLIEQIKFDLQRQLKG
jgi:hypothetical protein